MKARICDDWSEERVHSFLRAKFGYGISEFELSLLQIYVTYVQSLGLKNQPHLLKKIRRLERIKQALIGLIDKDLDKSGFYKSASSQESFRKLTRITEWTTENRRDFIKKTYKLEQLFSILDEQIESYTKLHANSEIVPAFYGVETRLAIKPINLLSLVWGRALKKGGKVDWINFGGLLSWFTKNKPDGALLTFFARKEDSDSDSFPDYLRLVWNKYKKTEYKEPADVLFRGIFEVPSKAQKEKYPESIKDIRAAYIGSVFPSARNLACFQDFLVRLNALFPDYFAAF